MSGRARGASGILAALIAPVLNVLAAFAVTALVLLAIGEDPAGAIAIMIWGAFGFSEAIGYTLYYATSFIFTGLAFALAFQAGLFNIGGEGQATLGGLGVALVCLHLDFLPFAALLPLAVFAAALFGAGWAIVPGWLQAHRGSHVVITTIMFNFIASALIVYLLVEVMSPPGSMQPETRTFAEDARLPFVHEMAGAVGIEIAASPLNLAFAWALLCCLLVWVLVWRTRLGYELRCVGAAPRAAVYAGISTSRITIVAMALSGALAGFMALNEIMGVQHRLLLEFTAGYGFVGIAVALMGRSHPAGIVVAAILFGALYQGGAELAFERPAITRDMIVVIQGLVILFAGALEHMFAPQIGGLTARLGGRSRAREA